MRRRVTPPGRRILTPRFDPTFCCDLRHSRRSHATGNVTEDEAGLLRVRYTSELAYEFETNVHIALHSEAAGVEAQLDATAGVIDCDEWLASAALSVHVGMVPGFEGRVTSGLSQGESLVAVDAAGRVAGHGARPPSALLSANRERS